MHAIGEYSISDLAELFSVSRPIVYRTLSRRLSLQRTILSPTGIYPFGGRYSRGSTGSLSKASTANAHSWTR